MKAADIHIKMNVALIKVRRTGFPYFRVRIYSFQFKPYLLTDTIALNSVLYKKQVKMVMLVSVLPVLSTNQIEALKYSLIADNCDWTL